MHKHISRIAVIIGVAVSVGAFSFGSVGASHSWGGYHWARTANPFTLKLGDNVSSVWDSHLGTASTDWSASSVLDTAVVSGKARSNCRPTSGRVEVCNRLYGANGWLGVAQIWVSGTHITQGAVKLNDTYFNTSTYNKPAWRQSVMCQEIGHTLGLDHQDEIFGNLNLGTCMDYTNDPDGLLYGQLSNLHPNLHDYEELELIYAHADTSTTIKSVAASRRGAIAEEIDVDDPSGWGKELRKDSRRRQSLFGRDLGKGNKVFTFVIWADNQ